MVSALTWRHMGASAVLEPHGGGRHEADAEPSRGSAAAAQRHGPQRLGPHAVCAVGLGQLVGGGPPLRAAHLAAQRLVALGRCACQ